MAERGGQPGNKNGSKNAPWRSAIERALAKRSRVDQHEALDQLAEKFLSLCDGGDVSAMRELGDRLEGKPKQQIVATGIEDGPIESKITVELVNASARSNPETA